MDNSISVTSIPSPPDSELGEILAGVGAIDDKTREDALMRASAYRVEPSDRVYIPQMIHLLEHEDTNVPLVLLDLLYQLGQEAMEALPAIKKCLNSRDKLVRIGAQELIDKLENRPAASYPADLFIEKTE